MKKYNLFIFNLIYIISLELIFKLFIFKNIFTLSTITMILFSIIISLILNIIQTISKNKLTNKIISIILAFIIWLLITAQFVYYQYYDTIFSIYSLFHGAQVFGFLDSIISVILVNIIPIILLLIPFLTFIICIKKWNFDRKDKKIYLIQTLIIIILYGITILCINTFDKNKAYSQKSLYYKVHIPKLAVRDFGVLTEMRLDLQRTIFGFKEQIIETIETKEVINEVEETKYNKVDIDFDELINNEENETIKDMHKYFKNIDATEYNEYTGMFEGKNLIVIVAEAFHTMAINKDLTPTLYKLYNEGFQFTNFYTPVYYVSTSDGEYVSLTSLLPKEGTWSMSESSDIYFPYVYGNLFSKYGYTTKAYHDGTYTFYNRNESLPNMGYEFKACYGGLKINCGLWPQSDLEMMQASIPEYINEDKFVTYYMTVSGHLRYTYIGNSMSSKNKEYVTGLPYTEAIQAYLGAQIELDRALEYLLKELEDNNKLDDTVIAISADHWPYGLKENINDYMSYNNYTDSKFDIHKNSFILWNNKMEKSIKVTKYSSSLDILPTILNLFKVEYDSRLLMGRDILSNSEGLIIFNDRSWITSYGKYDSVTEEFTPYIDNIDSDYVDKINKIVYDKFLMSKLIIENDYYKKILN